MRKVTLLLVALATTAFLNAQTVVFEETCGTTAPSSAPRPTIEEYTGWDNYEVGDVAFSQTTTDNADLRSTSTLSSHVWFPADKNTDLVISGISTANYSNLKLTFEVACQKAGANANKVILEVNGEAIEVADVAIDATNTYVGSGEISIPDAEVTSLRFYYTAENNPTNYGYRIDNIKIVGTAANVDIDETFEVVSITPKAGYISSETAQIVVTFDDEIVDALPETLVQFGKPNVMGTMTNLLVADDYSISGNVLTISLEAITLSHGTYKMVIPCSKYTNADGTALNGDGFPCTYSVTWTYFEAAEPEFISAATNNYNDSSAKIIDSAVIAKEYLDAGAFTLTFSEPMNKVEGIDVTITHRDAVTVLEVTPNMMSSSMQLLHFDSTWTWLEGEDYTLTIPAGAFIDVNEDRPLADNVVITFAVACGAELVAPIVQTLEATDITATTAKLNANFIINTCTVEVTEQGYKYRATGAEEWIVDEDGLLEGLTKETTYEFFAYANKISEDTLTYEVAGDILTFTTLDDEGIHTISSPEFVIYPNPANHTVYFSIEGLTGNAQVMVVDLTGKVVANMNMSANNSQLQLNVSNYAEGVYVVRVVSNNVNVVKKLVVKQ
ncbi:MAG: T9SS type A sorting domain-containing protein [Bacteroidales bacterium]|jgi:hypothetical protein|nr:T9SS type A sorting domain-containing protein [Bacteroidales bacterium]